MSIAYTCFTTDVIHEGHLNIIKKASEYGEVVVGVMTDETMIKFDRFPTIPFEKRMEMIEKLDGVSRVIKQETVMYDDVIPSLRPDYVIHGDNWLSGPLKAVRDNVEKLLSSYGGKIVDIPYTYNENVKHTDAKIREKLAMPEFRRKRLRQLLKMRPVVKALEVHSGLTGLIAEKTVVEHDGNLDQFDAMWISSL